MAETGVVSPQKRSWRVVVLLLTLVGVFLLGFLPQWLKARDEAAGRVKAERALTLMRMVKDLGSAAIDARRGQYEAARLETSSFFTAAAFEIDQREKSPLSKQQLETLAPLLASRDELITMLARSDAASADRLSNLFVSVRKSLGI